VAGAAGTVPEGAGEEGTRGKRARSWAHSDRRG
jgi:hypothetical protein